MDLYADLSEKRYYSIGVDFIRLEGDKIVSYLDVEEDEDENPRVILLTLSDVENLNKWKSKISTKKLFYEIFQSLKEIESRSEININMRSYIINVARKHKNNNIKHDQNIKRLA